MSSTPGSPNGFKHKLRTGSEPLLGLWCNLASDTAAEITAAAGFDWVLIDCEHAPNSLGTVATQLRTLGGYHADGIVRPLAGGRDAIQQLLDVGAQTLLVPAVQTPEDANHLALSMLFPPAGIRGVASQTRAGGWGRVRHYYESARDELCLIAQIETASGLKNARAIAETDGVDAVFVGTSDLAAALGHIGQPNHPEVVEAVELVVQVAADVGKPIGTLALNAETAKRYYEKGFDFLGVGIDTHLFATATSELIDLIRSWGRADHIT